MAHRARDWSALRIDKTPSPPPPFRVIVGMERCEEHGTLLLEYGAEGRYLCPTCLHHQWREMHESEFAWSFAYVLPRLYGRSHRASKPIPEDLRPWTVSTYQQLRRRVRKYAKEVLRIRGANQMDLEPLLLFVGRTPGEQWERLRSFERRVTRRSVPMG